MVQDLHQKRNSSEERNRIDYVKRWTDDIYEKKIFYSMSLYTLELTRRFQNTYRRYQKSRSETEYRKLLSLTVKLEEKLMQEDFL